VTANHTVQVNAGLAISMAAFTSGGTSFLISTCLILIFGEVIPRSLCSRHALAIGAGLIWPLRIMMVLLMPVAYPAARVLDAVLGEEIGQRCAHNPRHGHMHCALGR
jgi:metal transporter CNNM